MKRILSVISLVVLTLFLSSCSVNAQQFASKNCTEVGGSVSYSSTTAVANGTAASNSTSFLMFMPIINYYVVDGISIGISPGINIVKVAGAANSFKNYSLFVVPGYTFAKGGGNVFPYLQAMVGYTSLAQDADASTGTAATDLSGLSFGAKAGVKAIVGNSGVASFGVSYIMYNLSPKGASSRSGYNNLALSLGFSIFFGR